jgi:uroporphyrinogen III methyltransferase / synthase
VGYVQTDGKVYLVGSGPGAAGLLTLRAKEILTNAEVVVYDRLVHPRILNYVPATAKFIYVGKQPGFHAVSQTEIQRLLLNFAKAGKQVVRLKGGDPFVFGRGGEEAANLAGQHIPFEVVPGISSAIGVPAYAGIPVTHRDYASMFTVLTGHSSSGEVHRAALWSIEHNGTIVVLMGVNHLETIMDDLQISGIDGSTPVAIVQRGSWSNQKVVTGTVQVIAEIARKKNVMPPAIMIVGQTVGLRESLSWFENLPLFGQKILVVADTIREARIEADKLEASGAEVFDFAFERQAAELNGAFDEFFQALAMRIPTFIYFQTALGVQFFKRAAKKAQIDWRLFVNTCFLARDESVSEAIRDADLQADFIGSDWLHTASLNTKREMPFFLYEKIPENQSGRAETVHDSWLFENSIRRVLSPVSLLGSPFFKLDSFSQPIAALGREWGNLELIEKRVLSKNALQYFEHVVLPQYSHSESNGINLCKVDVT